MRDFPLWLAIAVLFTIIFVLFCIDEEISQDRRKLDELARRVQVIEQKLRLPVP